MSSDEIQVGVHVAIPTRRASFPSAIYYLHALLQFWHYPLNYLVIGEPYSSDDNVRLYMAPGYPQFCVESFHLNDLDRAPSAR